MTCNTYVLTIVGVTLLASGCDSRARGADPVLERDTVSLSVHPRWIDGERSTGSEPERTTLDPGQFRTIMAVWMRARDPSHRENICNNCEDFYTTEDFILVFRDAEGNAIGHRSIVFYGAPYRIRFGSEIMPPEPPGAIRTGDAILSIEELKVLMPFFLQAEAQSLRPPPKKTTLNEADIWADTRCVLETCPDLIPGGYEVDPADVSPTADHYVPDWDSYLKATGRK